MRPLGEVPASTMSLSGSSPTLFGIDYVPTNRRSPLPGSSPVVLLRMPEKLKAAIQAEAFHRGSNTNDVILAALVERARRALRIEPQSVGALRGRPQKGHTNGRNQRLSERRPPVRRTRCASRSSASATVPTPCSRASSTTRTPTATPSSPGSCTSTSVAITSRTSSSRPPSTSSRARSARISPTRSGRTRTTRSSSPRCRRPASRSHAG